MKKYRQLIIGIITGAMIFGAVPVLAQSVDVVFNSINITVNGKTVSTDNILYNDTTYVPLRAIGEMLDKEIGWDDATRTASINDKSAAQPDAKPTAKAGNKVYLITMDQMDWHWVSINEGCRKAVAEIGGIDYKWSAPDVKDDAKQIECINNAVADKADVILLAANGPDAVTSALKEADAAGVKIIYVDSAANYPSIQTLATDNRAAGETAGKEMLAALKVKGLSSGKIGIVNVNAATASVIAREEGFRAVFAGTGFEILETRYGEGQVLASMNIATDYIAQGVVGIFGTNEGSTIGIGNAVKEADADVIGVGFDSSDAILELIYGGYIYCAMAQNPEVMGYEGMKTAAKVLAGEAITEKNIDTSVSVLKKYSR